MLKIDLAKQLAYLDIQLAYHFAIWKVSKPKPNQKPTQHTCPFHKFEGIKVYNKNKPLVLENSQALNLRNMIRKIYEMIVLSYWQ